MQRKVLAVTLCLWTLAATNSLAAKEFKVVPFDDESLGLDAESISLATGSKKPIATSPVVATVITSEEIRNYGYRTVDEAISHVPGFHISPTSIFGINAVSVRGFTSAFTLLYLVDGKPYTNSLYGSKALDVRRMPMELIERIEILRGPGSSIYSTDAFLGVVNVVTKKKVDELIVRATGGSFETYEVAVTGAGEVGAADMVFGLNVFTTKGHQPFIPIDAASLIDLQTGTDTSLSPGNGNTDDKHISLETNFHNDDHLLSINFSNISDKGAYVGFLPILDQTGNLDLTNFGTFYEFPIQNTNNSRLIGSLGFDFRQWTLEDLNYYPPGSFGLFPDGVVGTIEHQEGFFTARINGEYSGVEGHQLTYSAQARSEYAEVTDFESNYAISSLSPIGLVPAEPGEFDVTGNKERREVVSFKINDEFAISNSITANLGISGDWNSEYDSFVVPRGALIWNVNPSTSIKLLAGQSVRTPSFIEALNIGSPALVPNPDLKLERLTSYDFVVDTKLSKKLTFKGNIFYHVTKNPVTLGASSEDPRLTPMNLNEQIGRGIEIETSYSATQSLGIGFYGLYQKNTGDYRVGDDDIQDVGFSPHLKLGVRIDYQWNKFNMGATYSYIGDRDRRPATVGRPEPDRYSILNLALAYELTEKLRIALKVENLLDEDALEMSIGDTPWDNEIPKRAAFLSLTTKW